MKSDSRSTRYTRSIQVLFYEATVSRCSENKRPRGSCSTKLPLHCFKPSPSYITASHLHRSVKALKIYTPRLVLILLLFKGTLPYLPTFSSPAVPPFPHGAFLPLNPAEKVSGRIVSYSYHGKHTAVISLPLLELCAGSWTKMKNIHIWCKGRPLPLHGYQQSQTFSKRKTLWHQGHHWWSVKYRKLCI